VSGEEIEDWRERATEAGDHALGAWLALALAAGIPGWLALVLCLLEAWLMRSINREMIERGLR
jgi:hypothetical protein